MPEWYLSCRGGIALLQHLLGTAVVAYTCRRKPRFLLRLLPAVIAGFALNAWFSYRFFIPEASLAALLSQVATSLLVYGTLVGIMFVCLEENPWRILYFASAGTVVNTMGGSFTTILRTMDAVEQLSQDALGILLVDAMSYLAVDLILFFLLRPFTKKRDFILDSRNRIFFSIFFVLLLMGHSWLAQNFTARDSATILVESTYDVLLCAMALMVMFGVLEQGLLTSRVALLNELMHQQERQFTVSKENAQLVNEKYHDLRKMLQSLRGKVPVSQLDELEKRINEYDLHINSGNPVLDVLLTEKLSVCSEKNVRLTCNLGRTDFSGIEELDLYTIWRRKGSFDGLRVGIVGDIAHSRVCGSLVPALKILGAHVTLIAPQTLLPARPDVLGADAVTADMDAALPELDVVYMLRVQMERLEGAPFPSLREYNMLFGLTRERDALMRPDAIICHPGPINRGVELDSFMADHPTRSVILDQVYAGVLVRMAALYLLLGGGEDSLS